MTKISFQYGCGFVLHKVHIQGYKGHFSAWYESDGRLIDAEQRVNDRSLRVGVRASDQLRAMGRTWK